MDQKQIAALIDGCLRYMRATRLPEPLPTNRSEYAEWREKASMPPIVDDDAEDAWFEVSRLADEEPGVGWQLLIDLAARCKEKDECAQIAAGPLTTFLRTHRNEFSSQIEEELRRSAGFRTAYEWLQ